MLNTQPRLMTKTRVDKLNKYLVLMPIVILIVHGLFSLWLSYEIKNDMLMEKFIEKQECIDLIDNIIHDVSERNDGIYDYTTILQESLSVLDKLDYTFGAVYNNKLQSLSPRASLYKQPFNPLRYKDFITSINNAISGTLTVLFEPGNMDPREAHIYFRWIQYGNSEPLLAVVAVTQYSLSTEISLWVTYGNVFINIITAVLNSVMVIVVRTGYTPTSETNKKHYLNFM